MKILWRNILAAGLALVGSIVAIRNRDAIGRFLDSMTHLDAGYPADERTLGLIAFGLVAVCFVAVLKLILSNRNH